MAKRINELFKKDLVVINMGLEAFAENLRKEQVKVLQETYLSSFATEEAKRDNR
jgi:hypothetical protein